MSSEKDPWETEVDPWDAPAGQAESPTKEAPPMSLAEKAGWGLKKALQGLGYVGGLSRGGIAQQYDMASLPFRTAAKMRDGTPLKEALMKAVEGNLVTPENIKATLTGEAPSGSQYLERAGVPQLGQLSDAIPSAYSETGDEWLKLKKGGLLDPTGRGTLGLGIDLGSDPLSYGSALARPAIMAAVKTGEKIPMWAKALSPVESAGASLGKWTFTKGLKRADAIAEEAGTALKPSNVLFENGITGSNKQIAKKSVQLANKLGKERDAFINQAVAAGIKPDMVRAMKSARDLAEQMVASGDPEVVKIAQKYLKNIGTYEQLQGKAASVVKVPLEVPEVDPLTLTMKTKEEVIVPEVIDKTASNLQKFKESLYRAIGTRNYRKKLGAPVNDAGTQIKKEQARGLKDEVELMVDQASGSGEALRNKNAEIAALLASGGTLEKEAMKDLNKNLLTSVDPIVAAIGGAPAVAAKKIADLSKTTWARTKGGKLIYDIANTPGLDPIVRESLINEFTKSNNPWESLAGEQK